MIYNMLNMPKMRVQEGVMADDSSHGGTSPPEGEKMSKVVAKVEIETEIEKVTIVIRQTFDTKRFEVSIDGGFLPDGEEKSDHGSFYGAMVYAAQVAEEVRDALCA